MMLSPDSTHWQFLALPDNQLEQADLVRLNLSVARGIPGLESLDVERYVCQVDQWTQAFERELPDMERMFHATPHKWKNDVRFFRVVMLMGFIGYDLGIRYNDEQFRQQTSGKMEVWYTDPGDLFLHKLIDTKQGTCANMPVLHAAMARRLGWPVGIAAARSHWISRFDDGEVYYNIEATGVRQGSVVSDPDEVYIEKFKLPKRAITCGSDLRKLTARETVGAFLGLRGRHYADTNRIHLADLDFALARVLFPAHRRTYVAALDSMFQCGSRLFDERELQPPTTVNTPPIGDRRPQPVFMYPDVRVINFSVPFPSPVFAPKKEQP